MRRLLAIAVTVSMSALLVPPAHAELKVGDKAPDFKTQASLGGTIYSYSLSEALKNGPVVVYFYPAAFTQGCTIEAHNFAEATDQYKELHATVIGLSADNIDTLAKFSVSECRSKFAVGADVDKSIMTSYDAVSSRSKDHASRTSYVIAPDGRIIYAFTASSPDQHVPNTLAALKTWAATHGK